MSYMPTSQCFPPPSDKRKLIMTDNCKITKTAVLCLRESINSCQYVRRYTVLFHCLRITFKQKINSHSQPLVWYSIIINEHWKAFTRQHSIQTLVNAVASFLSAKLGTQRCSIEISLIINKASSNTVATVYLDSPCDMTGAILKFFV